MNILSAFHFVLSLVGLMLVVGSLVVILNSREDD
jgi:hypothetical protein